MNIKASEVDTGEKALERCRVQMPDAILVDWQTPETSGIDFIETVWGRGYVLRDPEGETAAA